MLGGKFVFDAVRKGYSAGPVFSTMVEFFLRFLQFIFGIAVIGLYAQDLVHSRKAGDGMDSKWLFATIVGTIAALASAVYLALPCIIRQPLGMVRWLHIPALAVDGVMFILWLTVFGIFGKKYISVDADPKNGDLVRMKNAVWVDLVNLSFWAVTTVWWGLRWNKSRRADRGEKFDDEQPMREV